MHKSFLFHMFLSIAGHFIKEKPGYTHTHTQTHTHTVYTPGRRVGVGMVPIATDPTTFPLIP